MKYSFANLLDEKLLMSFTTFVLIHSFPCRVKLNAVTLNVKPAELG